MPPNNTSHLRVMGYKNGHISHGLAPTIEYAARLVYNTYIQNVVEWLHISPCNIIRMLYVPGHDNRGYISYWTLIQISL